MNIDDAQDIIELQTSSHDEDSPLLIPSEQVELSQQNGSDYDDSDNLEDDDEKDNEVHEEDSEEDESHEDIHESSDGLNTIRSFKASPRDNNDTVEQLHHQEGDAHLSSSFHVSGKDSRISSTAESIVTTGFPMVAPHSPVSPGSVFAVSLPNTTDNVFNDTTTSSLSFMSSFGTSTQIATDDVTVESDSITRIASTFKYGKQSAKHDTNYISKHLVMNHDDNTSLKMSTHESPPLKTFPSFTSPSAQTKFTSITFIGEKRVEHPSQDNEFDSTSNTSHKKSEKALHNSSLSCITSLAPVHQRYYYALEPKGVAPVGKEGRFKPFLSCNNRQNSVSENSRDAVQQGDINDIVKDAAFPALPFSRVRDDPDWRRACMLPSADRQLPLQDNLISAAVLDPKLKTGVVLSSSSPSNNFEPVEYGPLFAAALVVEQSLTKRDTVGQDNIKTFTKDFMTQARIGPSLLSQDSVSMTNAALCQAAAMLRTIQRL